VKGSRSFLKKRTKRLLFLGFCANGLPVFSRPEQVPVWRTRIRTTPRQTEKFFGSFFQKRTASLPAAAAAQNCRNWRKTNQQTAPAGTRGDIAAFHI
jgi:hypothetical protein